MPPLHSEFSISKSRCNDADDEDLHRMKEHEGQQYYPHRCAVLKQYLGEHSTVYERFFRSAELSRNPILLREPQRACQVPSENVDHKEQCHYREGYCNQINDAYRAEYMLIKGFSKAFINN